MTPSWILSDLQKPANENPGTGVESGGLESKAWPHAPAGPSSFYLYNAPSVTRFTCSTDASLLVHGYFSSTQSPSFPHSPVANKTISCNYNILPPLLPLPSAAATQIQIGYRPVEAAATATPQTIRSHGFGNHLLRLQAPGQYVAHHTTPCALPPH